MNKKAELRQKIYELDFAIYELVLFLDTHPTNQRAMNLLNEYRMKRRKAVAMFEERFGNYITTTGDVPANGCWKWLKGPWPWENNFMEEQ